MAYLVDTNVLVDFTRGSRAAADYLDSLGADWSISMITCLELLAGARTQRETDNLDLFLGGYHTIPPSEDIAHRAYDLMKTYTRSHGLHALDALIRGHRARRGPDAHEQEPQALPDDPWSGSGSAQLLIAPLAM